MIIKVLDRATLGFDIDLTPLRDFGSVIIYDETKPNDLFERIIDADVIIINKIKITKEVLDNANKLKLICVFATGYDNIDVDSCKKNNIAVCNVPAYSTNSVALYTVSTVLYLYTRMCEYKNFVTSGKYTEEGKANCLIPVYHEMNGKKWGIVGFGNIGKRVAKIAEALGAEIIVNKRTEVEGYNCVDIDTLCRESDIISLHCPLNESTRFLINEKRLASMKPDVILVNEARGAVVDEHAVAKAIKDKKIAGFGSDVYSVEPFPKNHPFYEIMNMPNVCLTPHCAWGAYESRKRALDIICDNINSFIDGKTLNRVDK